ncbi:head-tail adaptor protein [Lacipirellula sp.]|uniref:head-tail adaptor protein n=1 Tax=Lacipirellula sp. TaxID=2691419 RepID=UPI003D1162FB
MATAIGELRNKINFCTPNETRDKSGQVVQDVADPWTRLHRKVPAMFAEVSGGQMVHDLQTKTETTAVFVLRYIRGLQETMLIELFNDVVEVDGGRVEKFRQFEIVTIHDREGRRKWNVIEAKEVK